MHVDLGDAMDLSVSCITTLRMLVGEATTYSLNTIHNKNGDNLAQDVNRRHGRE